MPQLDKVTFVSQLFWLILLFTTLFFYMNNSLVPNIAKNIKYRKFLFQKIQSEIQALELKRAAVLSQFDSDFIKLTTSLLESFSEQRKEQENMFQNKLFGKDILSRFPGYAEFGDFYMKHEILVIRQ